MDTWIGIVTNGIVLAVGVAGFGTVLAHLVCGIYGFAKFGRPNWLVIAGGAWLLLIPAFFELFLGASAATWLIAQLRLYHETHRNNIALTVGSVLLLLLAVVLLCGTVWYNRRLMRRRGWISGQPRL